jgi:hypothetical protein
VDLAHVMMSSVAARVATCAFCRIQAASNTMDMTRRGLRCTACTTRADVAAATRGGTGIARHPTRQELRRVVDSGRRETMVGAALAIGGTLLTLFSLATGASIVVFSGAMASGLGMLLTAAIAAAWQRPR